MKINRVFAVALCVIGTGLVFAACEADKSPVYSARQIADVILNSQTGLPQLNVMTAEDEDFERHLESFYKLDAKAFSDGAVYYAGGTQASEIAVLELTGDAEPEHVEDVLAEYIDDRERAFAGYFPRQAALVENGVVSVKGDFVALLICENPAEAESAFIDCFGDDPPELPEPSEFLAITAMAPAMEPTEETASAATMQIFLDDEYDPDSVLDAWKSGEPSGLTAKNRAILEACAKMMDELITEDMQDHEKELAIHDWIAEWTSYDDGLISNSPDSEPHPDSDNPYGLFIRQKSTCAGYAHTFKLFMDLLEIECITVEGTNWWGDEEHMWNMVRLDDGEWYCVDVTWDDTDDMLGSEGAPVNYKYFNVTSDYMRYNDHQWDERYVPEATSTRFQ